MSHDAETELWLLAGELQQLEGANHYYSDLPPTAENYQDQWQCFAQQSDELSKIFNRLCAHLEAIGIKQTMPDIPDIDLPDMGVGDDEIPF